MCDRRTVRLLATLACLASPVLSHASEGPIFGGHVKAFLFERLVDPFEFERVGATLQLSLRGGSGRPASYFAAVDLRADSRLLEGGAASSRSDGFEVSPVEIHLDLSAGPVEARFGQQFVLWGRAAWMSPTDILTPWDYANMASEIEDYRLAPVAARVGWYPVGELHLDFVWVPVFRPNRLGFTPPREIGGLPVVHRSPVLPPRTLAGGELGVRISQAVSSFAFDWALSAYRGYEKMPTFSASTITDGDGVPISMELIESYHRLNLLGVDGAKALGPFVLLAEAAMKQTEWTDTDRSSTSLEYVAGVDWVVSESFDIGLQYVGRHRFQSAVPDSSTGGAMFPSVEERATHASTLRLRGAFSPNLGAQLLGVFSYTHVDAFLLAFAWWDVADAVQTRVGLVGFAGIDETTPYARQREHSRAFVELKYSF